MPSLFVPAVEIPGEGTHDRLFVATEHDSVCAFGANRPGDPPLWKVSFFDRARGVTVLSEDVVQCPLRPRRAGYSIRYSGSGKRPRLLRYSR